jgi:hypothetical protein
MILVTGTKRSGTSMWMHVLVEAGLPWIGERFPAGWAQLLREANPDGFFESELMAGINFQTNPHPLSGAYLAPHQTRHHAVKVFIPGLVRTDVAFIDRCVATIRGWRDYVASTRKVLAMQVDESGAQAQGSVLPPALEWWCSNFSLIRDLAIRGYPIHVVSYDGFLRDPERVATEVLDWIGHGDAKRAASVVRPQRPTDAPSVSDDELAEGIAGRHLEVFDELYETIDAERPLTSSFIDELNRVDEQLRPTVLEYQANADAKTIADILGRK